MGPDGYLIPELEPLDLAATSGLWYLLLLSTCDKGLVDLRSFKLAIIKLV